MSLKKYLKDHRLHLLLGLLAEGVAEASYGCSQVRWHYRDLLFFG